MEHRPSPLAAIAEWLRRQDKEIQTDIAAFVLYMSRDGFSPHAQGDPTSILLDWLDDEEAGGYRVVGKVLIFKALFEHVFANRFTDRGWVAPEQTFRSIVSESATDHDSNAARLAPDAFKWLREVPQRREAWKSVGLSWNAIVRKGLTEEALRVWADEQANQSFRRLTE